MPSAPGTVSSGWPGPRRTLPPSHTIPACHSACRARERANAVSESNHAAMEAFMALAGDDEAGDQAGGRAGSVSGAGTGSPAGGGGREPGLGPGAGAGAGAGAGDWSAHPRYSAHFLGRAHPGSAGEMGEG